MTFEFLSQPWDLLRKTVKLQRHAGGFCRKVLDCIGFGRHGCSWRNLGSPEGKHVFQGGHFTLSGFWNLQRILEFFRNLLRKILDAEGLTESSI